MGSLETQTSIEGQVQIWQLMFGFADTMALKCAVELGIADIMYSHGCPITLSQIASGIDSNYVDISYLGRIMRFLVSKQIFSAHNPSGGSEKTLYALNDNSKWLLNDADLTLAPMVTMESHPWQQKPWHFLSQCVKEGGIAFKKAHGCEMWDFASKNPEFNRIFNAALACTAKIVMGAFLSRYGDGFQDVKTLVDVGGGTGGNLAEVIKAYPHIKGINFDLPHVVATAPAYEGISHVGGDMFEAIPQADAVFMKWILHDWADEYCIKILKKCRKAMPEGTGKLILLEIVVEQESDAQFGDMGLVFDLLMFAHTTGGKERSEVEWSKLLMEGGFPRYKITKIPSLPSIIEAYPQ